MGETLVHQWISNGILGIRGRPWVSRGLRWAPIGIHLLPLAPIGVHGSPMSAHKSSVSFRWLSRVHGLL